MSSHFHWWAQCWMWGECQTLSLLYYKYTLPVPWNCLMLDWGRTPETNLGHHPIGRWDKSLFLKGSLKSFLLFLPQVWAPCLYLQDTGSVHGEHLCAPQSSSWCVASPQSVAEDIIAMSSGIAYLSCFSCWKMDMDQISQRRMPNIKLKFRNWSQIALFSGH